VIAVSDYERRLLLERFKLDARKVVVVPNGVDFKEFEGLKRRKRGFRSILYVGRLEAYKGVQYLIEVLPRLPKDVVLEVVGRGSLRSYLEKRAGELGVYDRVRFYQDLPRRELLQMFADADVFVLLSRFEAYSIAVAEALAVRTPCIVANTSALIEWIDNENCFGVDLPISLGGLADLLNHVLCVKFDRSDVGKCKSEKIIDWNNVVNELERVYEQWQF
jgi:glycosyltransferase involved in cell wall biosynthesis